LTTRRRESYGVASEGHEEHKRFGIAETGYRKEALRDLRLPRRNFSEGGW